MLFPLQNFPCSLIFALGYIPVMKLLGQTIQPLKAFSTCPLLVKIKNLHKFVALANVCGNVGYPRLIKVMHFQGELRLARLYHNTHVQTDQINMLTSLVLQFIIFSDF